MTALLEPAWRIYPALLIGLGGLYLLGRGIGTELGASALDAYHPRKALTLVRGLRLILAGATLITLAGAWIGQVAWLAILAAIIGVEETFETTLVTYGLTRGKDLRLRP